MSRTGEFTGFSQTESLRGPAPASAADDAHAHPDVLRGMDGKQACPFCGAVGEKSAGACPRCGMDNTPEARKATKARIGPWYVLQARNPAAPGMRFETLLTFVGKGRVRPRSVVRGPTTHQLWRFAAHVKGLSREFGLCFSCGSSIETTANICPQCNRLQEPPINPDVLLEAGADDAPPRPGPAVFRELAEPLFPTPTTAAPPASVQEEPEEIDIVIPALGGFAPDDLDARIAEPSTAPASSREGPFPSRAAPASPASVASRPVAVAAAMTPAPVAPAAAAAAPARPAADENPFAIAPARKKPNGEASFLSAKDLAAAFQLGFDPSADMDRIDVPDRVPSDALPDGTHPTALMPRNPLGTHAQPRRGGGFRKFLLFVFILAVSGLAVLMWVDPSFRHRAVDWCKAKYASLRGQTKDAPRPGVAPEDSFDAPMPMATTSTSAQPLPERDSSTIDSGASPTADSEPEPRPLADTAPAPEDEPETTADAERDAGLATEPEPVPARGNSRRGASSDDNRRVVPEATEGTKPGSRGRAKPASETPADPNPDAEAPPETEGAEPSAEPLSWRQLYSDAIDAESEGDYEAAVRAYEQIKKLPSDQWPGDLQRRLNFARSQMK